MSSSSTTPASPPGIVVKDSFHALYKTVQHALAATEQTCRDELDRLMSDLHHAKSQYEILRQEKAETLLELEQARREILFWKSTSEKAELRVRQQEDAIEQTCKESRQWKEQLMRVDEEKAVLRSRVNELVTANSSMSRQISSQELLTPRLQFMSDNGASASLSTPSRAISRTTSNHFNNLAKPSTSKTSRVQYTSSKEATAPTWPHADVIIAASSPGPSAMTRTRRSEQREHEPRPQPPPRIIKHIVYVNKPLKDEDEEPALPPPPIPSSPLQHLGSSQRRKTMTTRQATPGPNATRLRPQTTNTTSYTNTHFTKDYSQSTTSSDDEDELMIGREHTPGELRQNPRKSTPVSVGPPRPPAAKSLESPAKRKPAVAGDVDRGPRKARKHG